MQRLLYICHNFLQVHEKETFVGIVVLLRPH